MNKPQKPKDKKRNMYKVAGITVLLLLILAMILCMFKCCSGNEIADPTPGGIVYDSNAEPGGWDEADVDAIIDSLNQKLEEGMINISMNTSPFFKNGESAGNLMIVNETMNNYPQVVQIYRNDTDELIYTSGAIAVGSKIEKAPLDVVLPAGTYECTAIFNNVHPETGEFLGCAGAVIKITVEN